MFKKALMVLLALLLLTVLFPASLTSGPTQPPVDTTTLYVGSTAWGPTDADPAAAYDKYSQELIFNVYDSLIVFGKPVTNAWKTWDVHEQYWEFSPSLSLNVPDRQEVIETFNETAFTWIIDIRNQEPVPPPPITTPVCTWWEDDLPQPFMSYHIHDWIDNGDGILGPSDLVELEMYWWAPTLPEKNHLIGEFWFHVEDLQYYPPTDYKLVLTWVPTIGTEPPVCTWLTNAAHPGKIYHVCGYVDNNPDAVVGPCDVVYIGEYDVVPVLWEKIGPGTTYLPVTCRTWSVISAQLAPTLGLYLHHYYYDFDVRLTDGDGTTGNPIHFVDHTGALGNALTIDDYVYTFQRAMTQDYIGGPEWMFFKPMFDQMNTDYWDTGISADPICLAWLFQDAVEIASTNPPVIRINVGISFPDVAFKQVLCQTWASIVSKQWCTSVHPSTGLPCWDGDLFADIDQDSILDWWETYRHIEIPPFDPVQPDDYYGTGPYFVAVADPSIGEGLVVMQRNPYYWKGWPAKDRKSYLEYVDIEYISFWPTRRDAFEACQLDVCDVPRANIMQLLDPADPERMLTILPEIKTIKNIAPVLSLDAIFPVFTVSKASPSIYTGKFPDGIPYNFFNNTYVRNAFGYAFNHTKYLHEAWLDEAICRETPDILGLVPDYYCHSPDPPWTYDLDYQKVIDNLKAAMFTQDGVTKSVWDWGGFKLDAFYNTGNDQRRIAMEMMKATFDKLNADYGKNFQIHIVNLKWSQIVKKLLTFTCPIFVTGWQADFADADDFKRPFMHSQGYFALSQNYSADNGWAATLGPRTGLTKDTLIDLAVKTPDGPARETMYKDLDDIYLADDPSLPIVQPLGRRWQKYWVKGWYYNALYPSDYYYHLYKEDAPWGDVTGSTVGIPDGKVDMKDISYVTAHYGAKAPDPTKTPPYDPKWAPGTYGCGGCDVYGDRKVDMKDIPGYVPTHDVAVTNVAPSKTLVGHGYCMTVNVTVENQGDYTETFNVAAYANGTTIETKTLTLESKNSTTITFTWNTTDFAKGNYTISATAGTVPGETDTTDNTLVDGVVSVGVPCDVTGPENPPGSGKYPPDGVCNMRDIGYFCSHFMTTPSSPNWDPNCDVTGRIPQVPDGIVNMRDIGEACSKFMKPDP